MKKIFSILLAGVTVMTMGTSCSDSSYDDKYEDPSKTTEVGVPQVFTGILHDARQWTDLMYYRYYTQSSTDGLYSGVVGDNNAIGRFQGTGVGYFNTRWVQFYNMLTDFRLLEVNYNELPEDEKSSYEVFYHLSRAVVYAQLHEMLSWFGDVPFNGAGMLWNTGDYEGAKAAAVYDDDVELYKQILSGLKETGDYLAGGVDGKSTIFLTPQDYTVAAGNTEVWRKYVNSLRLRIALHLATNGDLTTEARNAIAEILNNPSQYPLIDNNSENMGVNADTQSDDFNYGKSLSQALRTGDYATVGATVLRVMNVPEGGIPDTGTDPRLEAMYDPNPDGEYVTFDITLSNSQNGVVEDEKRQEYIRRGITGANYYCEIDTVAVAGWAEYQGNENIMSVWINAAEVSLSKAEAYLMGYGVAANEATAKEYFIKGIEQSAEFYWDMKVGSSLAAQAGNDDSYRGYRPLTRPSAADITAYAESIWEPSQKAICEQLWLNFGFMNELEAWNVVRRTGYPEVYFSRDIQMPNYPTPAHRLPYVNDELTYNSQNVQEAISKNYTESTGYYTPLFWAKENYYHMID